VTDIFDKHEEELEEHAHYVNYDPDMSRHEHQDDNVDEAHRFLDELQVPRSTKEQSAMSLRSRIAWLAEKRHRDM
jgi:hypothetical protein